ncbi:MAG: tRNA (adenosine(37)-N6)-threonylcarbamoyltransferase complex transferase subunit TsaD [Patescibacteria group bacterium]
MSTPYHTILGIETSCDDTSIAVLDVTRGRYHVRSMVTASQVLAHRKTGGVVPEVAAREHAATIMPTLEAALHKAHTNLDGIDAIAVTSGPGLATALLVGVETARTLAFATGKPLIGVNHISGHLASCWLNDVHPQLPALALIVSGGHTELLWLEKNRVKLIGKTRDDAAGECFDKTAKLLGLPYPGGPELSKLARNGKPNIPLPRPMMKEANFEFSFAGLKTAVARYLELHQRLNPRHKADLAASIQTAIVDVLVDKTIRAAKMKKPKSILLGGGVAANSSLRERLAREAHAAGFTFHVAPMQYTTDNGAMIAVAGAMELARGHRTPWQKLDVNPVWELGR